jgi:hypothetical protein
MVVKYDHVASSSEPGQKSMKVSKACSESACIISFDDWEYDPETLKLATKKFCQKNHVAFEELERDIKDYLETGNESNLFKIYKASWVSPSNPGEYMLTKIKGMAAEAEMNAIE